MSDNPFTVTLYDKALQRTGWVNDFTSIEAKPAHCVVGSTTITVPTNHRRLPELTAKGARAVVQFQGEHLMSGYLKNPQWVLPSRTGVATLTVVDDLDIFWRVLGWPVPTADLLSQGTKKDVRTGSAETVAKAFLTANLSHNTVDPVTVATSAGRGSAITVESRMAVLADQLMAAVDAAGIGLAAKQVGNRIVVDAYTPRAFPHVLSESAGTVIAGTLSRKDPTVTRSIVGGPNENTSREFRQRTATALEAEYGWTAEGFIDARSAESHAEMDAAGDAALADGAEKAGISLTLSQSSVFTYGGTNGVRVGDSVQVDVGGGEILTSVLREAVLAYSRDDGLTITPTVGEITDDPNRTYVQLLADALRGLRYLRTR